MLSSEVFTEQPVVLYSDMFCVNINTFLQSFKDIQATNGTQINFRIHERKKRNKLNPIVKFATQEDADEIINIYKDIYEGTYPYKEMEDKEEVCKMINSPNVEWLVFKTPDDETIGCFTFILNFDDKMGYLRGLNLKKNNLGKIDVLKAAISSFITMYRKYEGKIFRWYGESRTAHTNSQYTLGAGGFKAVAFFPNKDVFYNKVESDILLISYDERALKEYRSPRKPRILPTVEKCFIYSDLRYSLGDYAIETPNIHLNHLKMAELEKKLDLESSQDKFGYVDVKFSFKDSDSYFSFLYTPQVQNLEKTKFKVKNLEELQVFIQEFIKYANIYNVRYLETYVSAYNPFYQKLFENAGLKPNGYIPSWRLNKKENLFEDAILFNWNKGEIDKNIKLLDEGKELLRRLSYMT